MGYVANQNHHADEAVDYVIIIPTSKKLYNQAKRLGDLHASHDEGEKVDFRVQEYLPLALITEEQIEEQSDSSA